MINYWNLLLSPFNAIKYFYQQKSFYNNAKLDNTAFLNKYPGIQNLELACSWSSERYLEEIGYVSPAKDIENVLSALQYIIGTLGIKYFRIKLDWNKVEQSDLSLKLPDIDKKILEFLFQNKCSICLNIGPMKSFRWPEVYFPQRIITKYNLIQNQEYIINLKNPIANDALEYLDNLCKLFCSEFTSENIENYIEAIQLDNEPTSRFGEYKLMPSTDYLAQTIFIADKYFPHKKILYNTPFIPSSISKILSPDLQFCFDLLNVLPDNIRNRCIIGLNFYNYNPSIPEVPIIDVYPDNYSGLEALYGKLRQIFSNPEYSLEVTESQFEPWGTGYPYDLPGKSVEHLRYCLLRHLKKLANNNLSQTKVSLWGIEQFIAKQKANTEIIELINMITRMAIINPDKRHYTT